MRVQVWVLLTSLSLVGPTVGAQPPLGSVEEALSRLGDRSAKVRAQAALVLGSLEQDEAVRAALRDRLGDPSPIVRAAAAKALGQQPSPDLLEPLAALLKDPDPMVLKWASWGLRRIVASMSRLQITDTVIRIAGSREAQTVGRTFESELLRGLLAADGPFELVPKEATLDFSERDSREEEPGPSTADVNRWVQEGRFDLAAMGGQGQPAPAEEPCPLKVEGTVEMREGGQEVVAQASVKLLLENGFPVLEGRVNVRVDASSGASEDRDEFTLEVTPAQLRIQAATEAGRRAAEDLLRRLRQPLQDKGRGVEGGSG